MSTLSNVSVAFNADTAKFSDGLNKMSKQTKAWSSDVHKQFDGLTKQTAAFEGAFSGAFRRITALLGAGAFIARIRSTVTELDNIVKASNRIGASAAEIQTLTNSLQRFGGGVSDAASIYEQLENSARQAAQGNREFVATFDQLGISAKEFFALSPDQKLNRYLSAVSQFNSSSRDEINRRIVGSDKFTDALTPEAMATSKAQLGGGLIDNRTKNALQSLSSTLADLNREFTKIVVENGDKLAKIIRVVGAAIKFVGDNLGTLALLASGLLALRVGIPLVTSLYAALGGLAIQLGVVGAGIIPITKAVLGFAGLVSKFAIPIVAVFTASFVGFSYIISFVTKGLAALIDKLNVFNDTDTSKFSQWIREYGELAAGNANEVVNRITGFMADIDLAINYESPQLNQDRDRNGFKDFETNKAKLDDKLAELDPVRKYQAALKELEPILAMLDKRIKQGNASLKDRELILNSLGNEYRRLINPLFEFEEKVAAIRANGNLTLGEQNSAIALLRREFNDVLDPAQKYSDQIARLSAATAAGVLPQKEFAQNLLTLTRSFGTEFRAAYDPAVQLVEQIKKLDALPAGTGVDRQKFIRSLADDLLATLYPARELTKQLEKINALLAVKALSDSEASKLRDWATRGFNADSAANRAGLLGDEFGAAEAELARFKLDVEQAFNGDAMTLFQQRLYDTKVKMLELKASIGETGMSILTNFGSTMAENFTQALAGAKSFAQAFKDIMRQVAADILAVIVRQLVLRSLFNMVGSAFGVPVLGDIMMGGARAKGGPVEPGKAYLVGEEGPELIVPRNSGMVIPNHKLTTATGGGPTVVQNFSFATGVTRQEVAALIPRIVNASKAAVADGYRRGGNYRAALT